MVATQTRLFGAEPKRSPRIRRGLDDTLKAMRDLGRVESIDTALIALARVTADKLDQACNNPEESLYNTTGVGRLYHDVLTHLLARPDAAATTDDQLAELFAAMADPPPG